MNRLKTDENRFYFKRLQQEYISNLGTVRVLLYCNLFRRELKERNNK